ncbi:MAG TPA: putative baseplate assembly protein, partial [Thermoanaerobaculia bacterium]|nr:putative baseplate assembly protein [Thermoanaerobaculia bacterium]
GKLSLDSVYDAIDVTPSSPGWMLLHKDGVTLPAAFRIIDAKTTGRAQYDISGKVTRVELSADTPIPDNVYPLRATTVYAASEALPLQVRLPLPETTGGTSLILDGTYPELRAGQALLFEGLPEGATANAAEQISLVEAPSVDTENGVTRIVVTPALQQYHAAGAILYANVAPATHGETVRNEILGSGDGTAFQTFALKKSPLTYLPAQSAEGLSAVESTLAVTVNNVLWHEQTTLLESEAGAREYVTHADSEATVSVIFGDGVHGARVPTGKDNVVARYRKGIGTDGNVASGAIQVLVDNVAGVQKVTNPIGGTGGADAETTAQIRTNAPESVRTFSRAISVDDYAALALTYPAVEKASASWVTMDPVRDVALERPYIRLTIATTDGAPLSTQRAFAADLRAYLDRRRDPNVQLRIVDFTAVNVELTAAINVLDDNPREATRAAVEAAARAWFAFERLGFGQSLRLSAVYAMLQGVAGVESVTITDFRRSSDAAGTSPSDVLIASTELAMLHALSITAAGGFADQ